MKRKFKYSILLLLVASSMSCRKDAALNVDVRDFNPDTFVKGALDDWLDQEFLDPFNIEVVYRWKRELSPIQKEIVPPREDRVQPAMEAVRDTWLVPYLDVAGASFIKTLCPKQIVLFGSAEYNDNGTITLGTADGGRRVVLNVINTFDKANGPAVKRMMRTVHHEFTHIINQMVDIPTDYQEISRGGYFSNWTTGTDDQAKELGFVSRYARMNELEDFAEMVAHLLVEGQFWFDNWVAQSPPAGAEKLRLKEQAVVDYFYTNFGIDFRVLQNRVAESFDIVTPKLPFPVSLRSNIIGMLTQMNPLTQLTKSQEFVDVWNDAEAAVYAIGNNAGRVLQDMQFTFGAGNDVTVRFFYQNAAGNNFNADMSLDMIVEEDGTTTFVVVPPRGSGTTWSNYNTLRPGVAPIIEWLEGNTFRADWMNSVIPGTTGILGGFFKHSDPMVYFYGFIQ